MLIITGNNSGTAFTAPAADSTVVVALGAIAKNLNTLVTGALLVNYGTLQNDGAGETSVTFQPNGSGDFVNKTGAIAIGAGDGVVITALGNVDNEGLILGGTSHGISLQNSANNNSIVNSGDIFGAQGGITVSSGAALNVSIINSGKIHGDLYGLWLLNAPGGAPVVVNTGTITGHLDSIFAQNNERLNVTNNGSLIGDVKADVSTNQADAVTNNGHISGSVRLGLSNDVYRGAGTVSGTVFGEAGADNLAGGSAVDRLDGGAGNDHLAGGRGRDVLTGGANNDFFVFNTVPNTSANRDTITDFSHAADTFQLDNAVFNALGGTGALKASFFFAGTAAHDADDHIIYNHATGALSYDSNGNAGGGVQQIAVLLHPPVLAANDFVVI